MNKLRWGAVVLLVPLFLAVCASDAAAGPTYAITNARIVPVNGAVIEKGSVVMRDGVIVAGGDILDVRTPIKQVIVAGRAIEMRSKHTNLYDKFKSR